MTFANRQDADAAYHANLDYDLVGDASKCRVFIAACRSLLRFDPAQVAQGGESMATNPSIVAELLATAEKWLAANDSSFKTGSRSKAIYNSLENFR